jgi:L,D-transpeptidase YbiS
VENKEPVPPPLDPSRKVEGELGKYALNIGDGYLIHGTKNEESLGRAVSHGCIRLGAEALEKLYKAAPVGTRVYIY